MYMLFVLQFAIIKMFLYFTISEVICLIDVSIKSVCFSFNTSIKHWAACSGKNCVRSYKCGASKLS